MHTKKALSLMLALALVLSCIPALSGSVSAIADSKTALAQQQEISGITVKNLQTLLADEVGNVTLHGVSYMEYTDVDSGSGTVWMYGRIDNDTANTIASNNESVASHGSNVYWHAREAAGGRIRLATDSSYIAISATLFDRNMYSYDMGAGKYGFSVYADTADGSVYVGTITGATPPPKSTNVEVPVSGMLDLSNAPKDPNGNYSLTIYFPLIIETRAVSIGIADGSVYKAHGVPYSNDKPVVFYGSSITQGGASTDPSNAYTATVSRALNIDYISFGMWGSCEGQDAFAAYLANLAKENMSVFVLDFDHNETHASTFGPKHKKVYEAVHNANPNIPIIMISRPNIDITSRTNQDNAELMKAEILKNYNAAVAAGYTNVHFIDGEAFFEYDNPQITYDDSLISNNKYPYKTDKVYLSDGIHPTNLGQASMADVVASVIRLANAGYENIYFDLDEISFGNGKETILFDSTDAVKPMTQANWSNGTVSNKALKLTASQSARLQGISGMERWSGYTAVSALNIAANATATVSVGAKSITVGHGTVTDGASESTFTYTANQNGSVDVVLETRLVNNGIAVRVNGTDAFFCDAGIMGGALSFAAANGTVTVNSLMITAPTVRASYQATLNSAITLNMNMYLSDAAQGAYAKFTSNGKTSDAVQPVETDGIYTFSYGVAAKNMADAVDVEIYNSENQMIAKHTVSIKNYADIIRTGDYSGKDQAVATALLNYGAAMQIYKGHNTGNLANGSFAAGWDSAAANIDLSKYQPSASGSDTLPEGVQFYATSLLMEDKTIIRYYFKMSATTAAGITVSEDNNPLTLFKSESGNGYYCVDIPVDASNLDYMYTLNLTDGNKTFQVRYSALSYVLQVLNPPENYSPNENMVRLAKAIYLYSVAVEAPDQSDDEFEILPF